MRLKPPPRLLGTLASTSTTSSSTPQAKSQAAIKKSILYDLKPWEPAASTSDVQQDPFTFTFTMDDFYTPIDIETAAGIDPERDNLDISAPLSEDVSHLAVSNLAKIIINTAYFIQIHVQKELNDARSEIGSDDESDDEATEATGKATSSNLHRSLRAHYLPYFIRHEAPSEPDPNCAKCDSAGTTYRCDDCFGDDMLCRECCNSRHSIHPFHTIKSWTPGPLAHFKRSTHLERQYTLHLGHGGSKCPAYRLTDPPTRFMIIAHTNGLHALNVVFCSCRSEYNDDWRQLLKHRIFPATDARPETAFTFQVLQHAQLCNLTAKMAIFDYTKTLTMLSGGSSQPYVRVCMAR